MYLCNVCVCGKRASLTEIERVGKSPIASSSPDVTLEKYVSGPHSFCFVN